MATPPTAEFDLTNIQGDILSGLPKKTETYILFTITNATKFRKDLSNLIPLIKTVAGVLVDRQAIEAHKKLGLPGLIPITGVNISFSHLGFTTLGIDDSTLCPVNPTTGAVNPFQLGQKKDAVTNLGDTQKLNGDPDWDEAFLQGNIHGLIIISGDSQLSTGAVQLEIEAIFGVNTPIASLAAVTTIVGDVRPGAEAGHEHFGFMDGISNPAVTGFDTVINPGPKPVNPGVIVTGHNGDTTTRASWATDGSFLAFRYLFQQVPEFNVFLGKNPIPKDGNGNVLAPADGSNLLGARMIGRWKSGAPIDITPFQDDPVLAVDPTRNNNFFFAGQINSQLNCPFAGHVRKTNPRNDLEVPPAGVSPIPVEGNRIMRRGVQFGPELSPEEIADGVTLQGRGLLFTCYQTNLFNGFQFLQHSWANNADFQPFETQPEKPGLDPIIGQGVRSMSGLDPQNEQTVLAIPQFIIPRGGEYFFTPSINGLKTTISTAS